MKHGKSSPAWIGQQSQVVGGAIWAIAIGAQTAIATSPAAVESCAFALSPPATLPQVEIPVSVAFGGQNLAFQVTGSTVLATDEITEAIAPIVDGYTQPELTETELLTLIRTVTDRLTLLYRDRGYTFASARPLPTNLNQAPIIEIQIEEGSIAQVQIEGRQRLNLSYLCDRLNVGYPFNSAQFEDKLRLLRFDPMLATVEATLLFRADKERVLRVRVEEKPFFSGQLSIDNYASPRVGSERLGVNARARNLTGLGDEFFAAYARTTTGGIDDIDLRYRVPLNPQDGTLEVRAAPSRSEITQPEFAPLGIRANKEVYEVTYRQPLLRSPQQEFALSFGFNYQEGQTFLFEQIPFAFGVGPDANGVSRTSTISFGQDYLNRQNSAIWVARSRFNFGTGLFDATRNPDPIPDGQFFSWWGQLQYVRQLNEKHLFIIAAETQLTPDTLLPAHRFVIGGGQSLRGYRENVRSGDNGFRLSVEDRITIWHDEDLNSTIQLAPFFDLGQVWNTPGNPNGLPAQTFLAAGGLGLHWQHFFGIPNLNLRLDYAYPVIELRDRGNNLQDRSLYFSLTYQF
jgi:hemolysin activation/secretion protein